MWFQEAVEIVPSTVVCKRIDMRCYVEVLQDWRIGSAAISRKEKILLDEFNLLSVSMSVLQNTFE